MALVVGGGVALTALGARFAIPAYQKWKAKPKAMRAPGKFHKGGFEPQMTRKEAALILNVRFVES